MSRLIKYFQLVLVLATIVTQKPICNQLFGQDVSDCAKLNNPFDRHIILRNMNETIEIGLNKTFSEKFECFQRIFDDSLVSTSKLYFARNNSNSSRLPADQNLDEKSKKHSHKISKKQKKEKNEEFSLGKTFGQIGFVFYSINEQSNLEQFKHESFIFVDPSVELNSNMSRLEQDVFAYANDVTVLKNLLTQAKQLLKEKSKLLKEVMHNQTLSDVNLNTKKETKEKEKKEKEKKEVKKDKRSKKEKKTPKKKDERAISN
jgi:hypothetical protein